MKNVECAAIHRGAPAYGNNRIPSILGLMHALGRRTPNFRGKYQICFKALGGLVRQWPQDFRVVTRAGFHLLHCDLSQYMDRVLFIYGVYEFDVDWMCSRLVQPGDVVVDIGACVGYHSLANALRVGTHGRVYSLEPQPELFERLRENIVANDLQNIEADQLALSDAKGILELHQFPDLDPGHASISTLNRQDYRVVRCSAAPLDEYLDSKNVRGVALVKLDVEGAELKVLKGASRLLSSSKPPMWIVEINLETSLACGHHPRELLSLFASHGYDFYRPVWGKFLRTIRRVEPIEPGGIEHGQNLLCAVRSAHSERLSRIGVQK